MRLVQAKKQFVLNGIAALLFIAFIVGQNANYQTNTQTAALPHALEAQTIKLFAFGEPAILGRILNFWLHSYDSQSGKIIQYKQWNYDDLTDWLSLILTLDPQTQAPLLVASRVFTEVNDSSRIRKIIQFIQKEYRSEPNTRWRWMADAAIIAKHRLHDQALALELAGTLRRTSTAAEVPFWVRDMEHLILADMGEWESASVIITSMLQSGTIKDARELRFLTQQLQTLKSRSMQKTPD